jgi:GT2 family glycosyltransferase
MGRTCIVVVAHNHASVLPACLRALDRAGLDPARVRVILVDNASADGTPELVRRELLGPDGRHTRGGLPAELIVSESNLGFAAGNNLALRRALTADDTFAYLLNPDTEVEPGFLDEAIAAAGADDRTAFVQSLLLRLPDPGVVNSFGNALHYLGFGYAAGDGQRLEDPAVAARIAGPREIAYPSGAATLIRLGALRAIGLLQEELFLYQEDAELGWRARLAGYRVIMAPRSRVRHRYAFDKGPQKYHWLERNRWLMLLWCYRRRTLLLLAPALLAAEAGVWTLALRGGWWREKARGYHYLLAPGHWRRLLATRRQVQALRRVTDREVSAWFASEIVFPAVSAWPLTHLGNPLSALYWRLVRSVLRW